MICSDIISIIKRRKVERKYVERKNGIQDIGSIIRTGHKHSYESLSENYRHIYKMYSIHHLTQMI